MQRRPPWYLAVRWCCCCHWLSSQCSVSSHICHLSLLQSPSATGSTAVSWHPSRRLAKVNPFSKYSLITVELLFKVKHGIRFFVWMTKFQQSIFFDWTVLPQYLSDPHHSSPEHRPNIPIIHYCFRFVITLCIWQWCCHLCLHCLEKSQKFSVFCPVKIIGDSFTKCAQQRFFLTPKPRGVAKFCECESL